jgi:hypothetical protein
VRVLGLDASSSYVGVAVVEHNNPGRQEPGKLLFLDAVPGSDREPWELADRVVDRLGDLGDVDVVAFEEPPPAARADVHHGFQAPIGLAIGLTAGAILGRLHGRYQRVQRVTVRAWWERWELVVLANRGAVYLWENWKGERTRKVRTFDKLIRSGSGVYATYKGCTHAPRVSLTTPVPVTCPMCGPDQRDPAEIRRDLRKAWTVETVRSLYPRQVDHLIACARERARTDKPDHQLAGVHDACDAVGVAHA